MLSLSMSPQEDNKVPSLMPSQNQRAAYGNIVQNYTVKTSEEGKEGESADAVVKSPVALARKLRWTESSYIYATSGRKPQLLVHLESYVKKQLHTINPCEPKYQELKLQVYRSVFGVFIKHFNTYQPLLSDIKKEYENTLAYQQDKIRELEPLQSHLRLVTEECDRKIQVRWEEEQAEIGALKQEKQQLQWEVEAMREKEKDMQAAIDHLQTELSKQYLQYREERDARKLLIWQLNEQTRGYIRQQDAHYEGTEEAKDPAVLQLTLKACREDLTKAQKELNRMKAEYWDVVPRGSWDILEKTHKQTLLQLKTLQGDFEQLKREHDTLLGLHKKGTMHIEMDKRVSHGQSSGSTKSGTLTSQEFRTALRTAFPPKSEEEIGELVASTQCEPDSDVISSQRLHSLLEEFDVAALPPEPDESEENDVRIQAPASN